jgi:aspartyl protease family protein
VIKILLGLLLGLHLSTVRSASFSCSKATTKVEKLICADPGLSSMDEEMYYRYQDALASAYSPESVKREQREWLNGDRNTCRSEKCLRIAYAARLDALSTTYRTSPHSFTDKSAGSPVQSSTTYRRSASSADEVALIHTGGVYEVPVVVNEVLKINFVLDSGAADVSISSDVALTLLKTGTIRQEDWLPGAVYSFADGTSAKSARFKIQSIRLGNRMLHDVTCSIAKNIEAPMLLGQSALKKLGSYQIDYRSERLIFR